MNLLIITADDMNGDSMGWTGSKVGATPNIDAFARTCTRLDQMHVSAPICQPSRSALMTGRVPHRNGALGFHPVNLDVPTLPEVLKSNGYFVAAINKTGHMQPRQKFDWDLSLDGSGKNPQAFRADFEQCLKAAAEAGKPFFINANSTDPHRPFPMDENDPDAAPRRRVTLTESKSAKVKLFAGDEVVVPEFLPDIPKVRKEVAQYFSGVRRLDQSFAEIISALKSAGHEENTVIVFFSDHGISAPFAKATVYYNGTWSPTLIRWPGMGKPVVLKNLFTTVDLMPTVLELLNVPAPEGMDGRSLVPVLQGRKRPERDYIITHVNSVSSGKFFPARCVRTATRSYIFNSWSDGKTEFRGEAMAGLTFAAMAEAGERDTKIKSRVDQYLFRSPEEFYDLENDPTESRNLINDPKHKPEIDRMRELLLAEMKRTGDPLLGQFTKQDKQTAMRCVEPRQAMGSSLAVVVEDAPLIHTAQFLPLNKQGELVGKGDAGKQAQQALDNLGRALNKSQSGIQQAVKLNFYLAQAGAKPQVEKTLASVFNGEHKPAVSFVVGSLSHPDALVTVDAVAAMSGGGASAARTYRRVAGAHGNNKLANIAVLPAGPKVYVSGMADRGDLAEATRKTLEKLNAVLTHLGLGKSHVVQLKAFLHPMSDVKVVENEIVTFFDGALAPPVVYVDWLSKDVPVEIELIASSPAGAETADGPVSFITPPGAPGSKVYSRVARINHGKLIYTSGLYGNAAEDATGQIREILGGLAKLMGQCGSDMRHLVKATYYVATPEASGKLNEIRPEFYDPQRPPAASKALVAGTGIEGRSATLDMLAVRK